MDQFSEAAIRFPPSIQTRQLEGCHAAILTPTLLVEGTRTREQERDTETEKAILRHKSSTSASTSEDPGLR